MNPPETDGGLWVAGDDHVSTADAVVASLEQVFTGLCVGGPTGEIRCCACDNNMGEGDRVSVDAYRMVETPRWQLARWWCPDCTPETIESPTCGRIEVRLSGRLAGLSDVTTQQHRMCLIVLTVNAFSSPQDKKPR